MHSALYIIEALQGGDELIFQQVFETYHRKLYAHILSKTKSEYLAEEVVQLTFIKLWEYRMRLTGEYALSTQIFRIAGTTLVDVLRKKYASDKKLHASREVSASELVHPRNRHDEKGFSMRLHSLLNLMPNIRRKAFEMSRMDGMSHREIAHTLSISEKAVENHIYKATRQLRKSISTEYLPFLITFLLFFH